MLALTQLAEMYETAVEMEQEPEGPSERVLRLAQSLPHSAPELEQEALRVERLLEGLREPLTEDGAELWQELVDIFENQIEAIVGLLNAEAPEDVEWSCELLVQTHTQLEALEERLAEVREEQPLFG